MSNRFIAFCTECNGVRSKTFSTVKSYVNIFECSEDATG
ncbi:MAG: hypothetical protein KA284_08125 [Bacteroidia bacterium]|nr:hypothetical protein [Bacteroidia bacterium]